MKRIIFFLALFSMLLSVIVFALTCDIYSSCPVGYSAVFKMSANDANAHAELYSETNYNYAVCCDIAAPSRACDGTNGIVNLSAPTNAHVENKTGSNYKYGVCFQDLVCDYRTNCGADECLASMSADTNAHLGNCSGSYSKKICCISSGAPPPPCGTELSEINCGDGIDDDCDGDLDCEDSDCNGGINGTVKNSNDGLPIESAAIGVMDDYTLTELYTGLTDFQGFYDINRPAGVKCGNYTVAASKQGFSSSVKSGQEVPPRTNITVDFSLIPGGTCLDDCTYLEDEDRNCQPDCNGTNGCLFYDNNTIDICRVGIIKGWIRAYNSSHTVECCEGAPEPKGPAIEANVTCAKENLVEITRIVRYRGKPIKAVVVVCK